MALFKNDFHLPPARKTPVLPCSTGTPSAALVTNQPIWKTTETFFFPLPAKFQKRPFATTSRLALTSPRLLLWGCHQIEDAKQRILMEKCLIYRWGRKKKKTPQHICTC